LFRIAHAGRRCGVGFGEGATAATVLRSDGYAKFWLSPVSLVESGGYDGGELRQLLELVREHREMMERAWNDHFST
jgi:hypothetical protein